MTETTGRPKTTGLSIALFPGLWLLALLFCMPLHSTELRLASSFAGIYHTGWGVRDGVPPNINDLAQTTDGYLWIATEGGLYRFDGVRFEQFQPQSGPVFPSDIVTALLAQPDGSLWIGYLNRGASLLKDGRLTNFGKKDGLGAGIVYRFVRDLTGSTWAATELGLKRFDGSHWDHVGTDWNFPASRAEDAFVDHQGTLWVSSGSTLVYLRRGERRFRPTGLRFSDVVSMSETQDGVLLTTGIKGRIIPFLLTPGNSFLRGSPLALRSVAISVDRKGMLWVATTSNGVWRLPAPAMSSPYSRLETISNQDRFTRLDGMTSNEGDQILEDAENDVWVATTGGLDRFRRAKLNSVALPSGAEGIVMSPADGGGIFVSTGAVSPGILHVSRNGAESVRAAPAFLSCAYRDRAGTLWLGGLNALWKFSKNHFFRVPLPPNIPHFRAIQAITIGPLGDLWVAIHQGEMFRLADDKWARLGGISGLPRSTPLVAYTDSLGRVWFGYEQGAIALLKESHVKIFSSKQGLKVGSVTAISEKKGNVWIGGTSGLQRFDGTRFFKLTTATEELKDISGIVERSNGDLWLNQRSGIARIDHIEINKFKQDTRYHVRLDMFNALDGMPGASLSISRLPSAVESSDGTLWFTTSSGLVWIDPEHIPTNHIIPTVLVQSVKADDKTYSVSKRLTLPNRTQNLAINYTALSLSMPERVRFRYILEGFDEEWQQAGARRQAFYSQLPPGGYRFRVIACNDDGAWNMAGANYEFTVAPAYYQTSWFRVLTIVAVLLTLSGLYRLRLRQVGRQVQLRYEERLAERTRIARDLHDTLLQSFHGLILRFQAVRNMLPTRPTQAMEALEIAIDRAANAITEGRDAVQELRSSQMSSNGLVETLTLMGRELEADNGNTTGSNDPAKFRVLVEGTPRHVHPTVQDNFYRITREALSNAFCHARASQIEVDIRYSRRMLRLRVRDDGIGMDPRLLFGRGRAGHWGLPGMRERARSIGGHFELWSEVGQGTEVEVTVPGAIAYKTSGDAAARMTVPERGDGK